LLAEHVRWWQTGKNSGTVFHLLLVRMRRRKVKILKFSFWVELIEQRNILVILVVQAMFLSKLCR
jgi:hypothetical protein